jgi:DNA-binding transcriptional ArsR family regulator
MASRASRDRRLSVTFAALADPTRRAILARLMGGPAPVTKLAEPFDISMPAVSRHLKVLERAGLIVRGRAGQLRPCALAAAPLEDVARWLAPYWGLRERNAHAGHAHAGRQTQSRRRKAREEETHDRTRRPPRPR